MKNCLVFLLLGLFFLACCDRSEKGYLQNTIDQKARAQKIILEKEGKDAIMMYRMQNQRWPATLEDVSNLPSLPKEQKWEWVYDNTNGNLSIEKKP